MGVSQYHLPSSAMRIRISPASRSETVCSEYWRYRSVASCSAWPTDVIVNHGLMAFTAVWWGRLRLVALIDEPGVNRRILGHLGLPTEVPAARLSRAPPIPL